MATKDKTRRAGATNKLALPLLVGLLVLSGCASHYVIKLSNGSEITTASKPRLEGEAWHFKDAKGQEHVVARGRVREIAPASMAAEEKKKVKAPKSSAAPHKRKWYFLWLF
jgi:hypothetical protein